MSGVHNIFVGRTTAPATAIERSLRTRSSASARLSRTYATTPTDNKKITISMWIKLGSNLGTARWLFNGWNSSAAASTAFGISSGDCLTFQFGGASAFEVTGTEVLRDPTAWYHVMAIVDTTLAYDVDRVQMYMNGRRVTAVSVNNPPALNATHQMVVNTANNSIAAAYNATGFFDGYISEMHVIDGQAVSPANFGQVDNTTGQWSAKTYTGTYGTNGFYLNFKDPTSTTTLCLDRSGNARDWTPNNISVTAGATYDSMTDSPLSSGSSRGNYLTLNAIEAGANSLSNGNLTATYAAASVAFTQPATFAFPSGNWYHEANLASFSTGAVANNVMAFGWVSRDNANTHLMYGWFTDGSIMRHSLRYTLNNVVQTRIDVNTTAPISTDVFGLEFNIDTGVVTAYKNGTQTAQISSITNTKDWTPMLRRDGTSNAATWNVNYGQRPFSYSPLNGGVAMHTGNITAPAIVRGDDHFAVSTYVGNGSTQNVTGLRFQPGFVWTKARDTTTNNNLYDLIRGVQNKLLSDANTAQTTASTSLTAFNSDGFSLGTEAPVNALDINFVGWSWKAGSSVSNTSGTITSQVAANTTAGFSVVTWTGTGANATVGHGLGAVPTFIIVKQTNSTGAWAVLHQSANGGDGGHLGAISLSSNASFVTDATQWNSTKPTSSVFSVGTSSTTNAAASTYVAYCFTPIVGYSAISRYIGNASTDGTFVHCGFKPRLVLYKRVDATGNWQIMDTARDGTNPEENELIANSTAAEAPSSTVAMDVVATGFKLRNTNADRNASGGAYCFIAFAESPFKYSTALGVSSSESPYALNRTISATTLNYTLRTLAINAGWNQKQPLQSTTTINAAVVVGSASTGNYAFDTGIGVFPSGSSLAIINNGSIMGAGGAGGPGGANAGAAGGPALVARYALTVTNNGTVGGGGGGGGGGRHVTYAVYGGSATDYGGGGGGGQGQNGGSGGSGVSGSGTGGTGTSAAAGGGGAPTSYANGATAGASGGTLGAAGGTASSGGSGGAGGACTGGNANITWLVTGTRLGTLA